MSYLPQFNITMSMSINLMRIQESATIISQMPLPVHILKQLQHESMVESIIYSTKIEGNLLDEKRKREAIRNKSDSKDAQEVYNLWKAMEFLEECELRKLPLTEELIKKLHAIINVITSGRRPKLSPYRIVQNKVSEKDTGKIVYLPPEPQDVPLLMEDLVAWVNSPENMSTPAPIKAGIFLYQFLTIHPYMDGNGRTGRALATYILRLGGLGLNGLFVLEKYYDRHLKGYYDNLQLGLNHNYYFGRNDPDLTPWLNFFIIGLAEVFQEATTIVKEKNAEFAKIEPKLIRALDIYQRPVFAQLTFKHNHLTTADLQKLTGFADRTIRDKVKKWIEDGFIVPLDPNAQRIRAVKLAPQYQELADEIISDPDSYKYLLV